MCSKSINSREQCRHSSDSSTFPTIVTDFNSYRLDIRGSLRAKRESWHGNDWKLLEWAQKAWEQGDKPSSRNIEGEVLAWLQPHWG